MLTSFLDRFLMRFCYQLRPPEPEKSSPRCSESTIFQKIAFRTWHRFLIDFGANLPSQNPSKSFQKPSPRAIIFLIDFWIDFLSILAPSWSHVGHFSRPRRFQDASKTIQDAFKNPLDRPRRPKRPPNLPRSPPDLDFGRFLIDVWSIFD